MSWNLFQTGLVVKSFFYVNHCFNIWRSTSHNGKLEGFVNLTDNFEDPILKFWGKVLDMQGRGQSYKSIQASGWRKIKCLNCWLCLFQKSYSVNTFESNVLKFWPNIFLIEACYQVLGQVCKFVLRCKKFYSIGPWFQLLLLVHIW